MHFEIIGEIRNVEEIAVGCGIRDIMRLRRNISNLENLKEFRKLINTLWEKEWFVFAKKPFAGPEQKKSGTGSF